MSLEIKIIEKKNLITFLDEGYNVQENFMICTSQRLLSLFKNPFSDNNDAVFLLPYYEGRLVGYMGVYHEHIYINNKKEKIGWLSTWWLSENAAGKGIGKQMLKKVYELNEGKIGISSFTESAKRVYDKSGYFQYLKTLNGIYWRLSFKKSDFPKNNLKDFILKNNLKLVNKIIDPKSKLNNKLTYRFSKIDNQVNLFLDSKQDGCLCKRNELFFKHISRYPWIKKTPIGNKSNNLYFFSDMRKEYEFDYFSIYDKEKIVGFVSYTLSDGVLKVKQLFYESNYIPDILNAIIHLTKIKLQKGFIIYDNLFVGYLTKMNLPKRSKITFLNRDSIISKAFTGLDIDKLVLQYGDGDTYFT